MYVCICNNVTDSQIRLAVESGARSLRDVRQSLNVASQCGKCGQCALRIIRDEILSSEADDNTLSSAAA